MFARDSQVSRIDRMGRNSFTAYTVGNEAWIMSASQDMRRNITISMVDISRVNQGQVTEYRLGDYTRDDFATPDGTTLIRGFNFRDLRMFTAMPNNDQFSSNSKNDEEEKIVHVIGS